MSSEGTEKKQVSREEFLSKAGKFLHSETQEFGTSPNKKILAVFHYENGYETFSHTAGEGWRYYLFLSSIASSILAK